MNGVKNCFGILTEQIGKINSIVEDVIRYAPTDAILVGVNFFFFRSCSIDIKMKKDLGYYLIIWSYQFGVLALFFLVTTLFGDLYKPEAVFCSSVSVVCYAATEIFIYFKDRNAKNTTD